MILGDPLGAAYQALLQSQALGILVLAGDWKSIAGPNRPTNV